jgi:hypothetical protein
LKESKIPADDSKSTAASKKDVKKMREKSAKRLAFVKYLA